MFPEEVFCPLSPRQMEYYKNDHMYMYEAKDDIWALGITLLCFIYYEDFNFYYNWSKREINMSKINMHLEALHANGMNAELVQLIERMLNRNEKQRISLTQL